MAHGDHPRTRTKRAVVGRTSAGRCPARADAWRDVRGFALKCYTSEGTWDLVGNNTPVFFVRDPMKFSHFIRRHKRLPDKGLRDQNMQWDFWTSTRRRLAHLPLAQRGREYPSWTLRVQVMPDEEAKTSRHNNFDLTKVWSHKDYPLIDVGRMTLNENPENFFAQIDQAAFAPSNIVRGIGFSPDRMQLARVFAYADAHRAQVGVNHDELPVNRPVVETNTHTFDGPMRYEHKGAQSTYAANSGGRPYADNDGVAADGWEADGEMIRAAQTLRQDVTEPVLQRDPDTAEAKEPQAIRESGTTAAH